MNPHFPRFSGRSQVFTSLACLACFAGALAVRGQDPRLASLPERAELRDAPNESGEEHVPSAMDAARGIAEESKRRMAESRARSGGDGGPPPSSVADRPEEAAARAADALKSLPASGPKEAVGNVLLLMGMSMRYDPSSPKPRGPHEWSAEQAIAAGSVNGCVESAKAFFKLFTTAYPSYKALYIDSFNADCPSGGHAVVEVEDGAASFIVDAASFERLGAPRVTEQDLEGSIDIRPKLRGRIIQIQGKADIYVSKWQRGYVAAHYPYGRVFEGQPVKEALFPTLDDLNRHLAAFHDPKGRSFEDLRGLGLILEYTDKAKSAFLYKNWCGPGLARHVVYGCFTALPSPDEAEKVEPSARKQFQKEGKVSACSRSSAP